MLNVPELKTPVVSLHDILCGTCESRSSTIPLRAGPVKLLFEQPEEWWRDGPAGSSESSAPIVNLPRSGLARLEMEP